MNFRTNRRLRLPLHGLLVLAMRASPALAQSGNYVLPPVILEDFGVFCPDEPVGRIEAPDTERGFIDLVSGNPPVDFHTDVVPAELGLGFGMRFRLAPGEATRMARVVITHPPFGTPPVSRETYAITLESDFTSMTQFDFDETYEMQPGRWNLAIEVEGGILLSHDFTVVPADQSLISTKMCKGPALLS
ncbi:DUF3859 domain-containing protein [Pseudooceanicola sp.]|uniref:DUF3859 domain-containing protein n=1 Tax=Pseudooceanicola sp. TaxID=1914328 RepID=UPI0026142A53|nr:DUF3859 domain-containing protein [Pseudooceanicola sp.]MDF1855222.1 DUF3859 domain-containing protein [Pseudooceanicola sp.]